MTGIFDPMDETDVNDQCCRNCKWWNPDPVNDKMKCRNRRSEKHGVKTTGDAWCWCWQKNKSFGRHGDLHEVWQDDRQ